MESRAPGDRAAVVAAFGAGLFALLGGGTVSVFDALTFVAAAMMISRIRLAEARPAPQAEHWRADLIAGFAHIRRAPGLLALLAAASVVMSFSGVLVAAQYSLVQGVGEPPSFLGVFSAALGAGSVVSSLVSGRLLRLLGERWLAVAGMANFAVGNLMRATGLLPVAVAGSLVLGFALPWLFLALLNLSQRCTPPELQGRVSAVVSLVFFGPQAPLLALGALFIRYATYSELYLAGAAVAVATGIVFIWAGRRRNLQAASGLDRDAEFGGGDHEQRCEQRLVAAEDDEGAGDDREPVDPDEVGQAEVPQRPVPQSGWRAVGRPPLDKRVHEPVGEAEQA